MANTRCRTCSQLRTACACPPPLPDTTGRAVQLQADRARVCGWLGGQLWQHNPTIRAWVDAEIARARAADEVTIQQMLAQYDIIAPPRRKGTGHYPTPASFYNDVVPILHRYWQRREHPSAEKVAEALPVHLHERQLRRLVHQLFGLTWEKFLHTVVRPLS